jgi:hypothetical protein
MNKPEDKRFFPRAMVSLEAHIEDNEKRWAVDIVDLTVHGVSFQSERALPGGSRVIIVIDGSENIRNNELKAEILRCESPSKVNSPPYVVAAKFLEANDEYLMDALALVHGKQ